MYRHMYTDFEVFENVVKHCLECDISSQLKLKLKRKWRNKIVKIYAN